MSRRETVDFCLDQLQACASEAFFAIEQYSLLQEKVERMNEDCKTILREDERDFVKECFDLLLIAEGYRETYLYRRGMRDCAALLKALGVFR